MDTTGYIVFFSLFLGLFTMKENICFAIDFSAGAETLLKIENIENPTSNEKKLAKKVVFERETGKEYLKQAIIAEGQRDAIMNQFSFVDLRSRIMEFFAKLAFGLPKMEKTEMKAMIVEKGFVPENADNRTIGLAVSSLMGNKPLNERQEVIDLYNYYGIQCLYVLRFNNGDDTVKSINKEIEETDGFTDLHYCAEVSFLYEKCSRKDGAHPTSGIASYNEVIKSLESKGFLTKHTKKVVATMYNLFGIKENDE